MKEYREKLYAALAEIERCPVTMRSVEQATAVAELLCWLDKLEIAEPRTAHFDREVAKKWAEHMQNADGSTGAHWTMAQADAVADSVGVSHEIPRWAWGVTLNMMYSDYYDVAMQFGLNRPEFYAALAKAFLIDKDAPAPEEKLLRYYQNVVK